MEEKSKCNAHKKLYEFYCENCKKLICKDCKADHVKKKCKNILGLTEYFKTWSSTYCKSKLDTFDTSTYSRDMSTKQFDT